MSYKKDWIGTAFKLAEDVGPFAGAKLGAILVYKGEIISFGTNKNKTHPFQKKFGSNHESIFLHAEIDAFANALRRFDSEILRKSSMYIARAKWSDSKRTKMVHGLAKPCIGCQRAIAAFDVKHVCYTTDDGVNYL